MSEDPERLLAEALRAQARYAPPTPGAPPSPAPSASPPPVPEPPAAAPLAELSGGYGLLAGSDDTPLAPRHPPADAALPGVPPTRPMTPPTRGSHRRAPEPLPAGWVLILAASLGLAVGSVIGLLTLL